MIRKNLCLAGLLVFFLSACGGSKADGPLHTEDVELTVFAAASLQEALTESGKTTNGPPQCYSGLYFDSSGTLKRRFRGGRVRCFISAGQSR